MAADDDQGYVPLQGQKQGAPVVTPPPKPVVAAPKPVDPNDQGYVPLQTGGGAVQTGGGQQTTASQPSGWGVNWRTGDVTMPQSAQDWSTIAAQNSLMGLYPGLNAQADAARKRLDPLTAGSADVVGSIASPTTLLNAVPYVGPELAGGLHEGIKSATNWSPGESWGDYLKRVGEDTAGGAVAGLVGQGAAKAAPVVLPQLTKAGIELGPAAAMTAAAHKLFGEPYKDILTALGGYALTRNLSEGAGEAAKKLAASPLTQQAIKSLILGGSSAARTGVGPWDQLVP